MNYEELCDDGVVNRGGCVQSMVSRRADIQISPMLLTIQHNKEYRKEPSFGNLHKLYQHNQMQLEEGQGRNLEGNTENRTSNAIREHNVGWVRDKGRLTRVLRLIFLICCNFSIRLFGIKSGQRCI